MIPPLLERDPPVTTSVPPVADSAFLADLPADTWQYFARNSLSFSFAAVGFKAADRRRVSWVYAFCRLTDDLVDRAEHEPRERVEARLDAWLALSRRAFETHDTGIDWLDAVMAESAQAGMPFSVITELVDGVRMDLGSVALQTVEELDRYAYPVASVVGIWMCYLFGVRAAWMHERAAVLGRAMQITNILRDVGEDLRHNRIYLPADLLRAHNLTPADLRRMQAGGPTLPAYHQLVEALMARAERYYEEAWEGIVLLPRRFGQVMAVAAPVYRGIHRSIRRNGYDNFRRRAYTSFTRKLWLAVQGRWRLSRLKRRSAKMLREIRSSALGREGSVLR